MLALYDLLRRLEVRRLQEKYWPASARAGLNLEDNRQGMLRTSLRGCVGGVKYHPHANLGEELDAPA